MNNLHKVLFLSFLTPVTGHCLIKTGVVGVDPTSYSSINTAVTAAGTTATFLNISSSQTLAGGLIIPSNITLRIQKGGVIIKASTYTLTISGDFQAGEQTCFSGFSSGEVNFSSKTQYVSPVWWGAVGDNSNSDNTAIQNAIGTGKRVKIPSGTYKLSAGLTIDTEGQIIEGAGQELTVFTTTAALNMMTINQRYVNVRHLGFDGADVALRGIYGKIPKVHILDCYFTQTQTAAIDLESFTNTIEHNTLFDNNGDGVLLSSGSNNNNTAITENVISNNAKNGIRITSGSPAYTDGVFISKNSMENNCTGGSATTPYAHINIEGGSRSIKIEDSYHESDISQSGYASQLFVFIGQGCENITIRDSYMAASSSQKLNYYIEIGTSSTPIQIENCSLKNSAISAVHDFSGANGNLNMVMVTTTTAAPNPMYSLSGNVILNAGVHVSTGPSGTRYFSVSPSSVVINSPWVIQPLQPSFLASAPVNTANVTGDGTTFTIEYDTEILDPGSNYNTGTYTFTAPASGKYNCSVSVLMTGVDASHTGTAILTLTTSNRDYIVGYDGNSFTASFGSGNIYLGGSVSEMDMDVGDTAFATIRIAGGTKTCEVLDSADFSKFACSLMN